MTEWREVDARRALRSSDGGARREMADQSWKTACRSCARRTSNPCPKSHGRHASDRMRTFRPSRPSKSELAIAAMWHSSETGLIAMHGSRWPLELDRSNCDGLVIVTPIRRARPAHACRCPRLLRAGRSAVGGQLVGAAQQALQCSSQRKRRLPGPASRSARTGSIAAVLGAHRRPDREQPAAGGGVGGDGSGHLPGVVRPLPVPRPRGRHLRRLRPRPDPRGLVGAARRSATLR